ncbi:MAG: hypothetical protein MN733_13800 [Nitrososphaera sp.]|nr:hypothetical protein [Nitrososphaera sp.]
MKIASKVEARAELAARILDKQLVECDQGCLLNTTIISQGAMEDLKLPIREDPDLYSDAILLSTNLFELPIERRVSDRRNPNQAFGLDNPHTRKGMTTSKPF